jgi:hypothetical protein
MRQMTRPEVIDGVAAAWTAVVPGRVEHEVLDDELFPPFEQVQERYSTVWPIEGVRLVNPHHRQLLTLGAQRVAHPGSFFLLR